MKVNNSSKRATRDRLVLEHLFVCRVIACHFQRTMPVNIDLEDLIQAGMIGLLKAADNFDPTRQIQFSTYAAHRIRGAILDSLRKLDFAPRTLRRRWKKAEFVAQELGSVLQREATEEEIAERLHINLVQFNKLRLEAHSVVQSSTCRYDPAEGTLVEREFKAGSENRPDMMFSVVEMQDALDNAMKPLRPRQREVMRAYYSGQMTMKEIGLWLGVNESRVSQLHKAALIRMQIVFNAQGVCSSRAFFA